MLWRQRREASLVGLTLLLCADGNYVALTALYEATDGAAWISNTNWLSSSDPCSAPTWTSVTCSGSAVTGLSLTGVGLAGTIPASPWALLQGLTGDLDLAHDGIAGTIPVRAAHAVSRSVVKP